MITVALAWSRNIQRIGTVMSAGLSTAVAT